MISSDDFIRIRRCSFLGRTAGSNGWRPRGIVWFENIQTFELLIQHGERLESLCLDHLTFEPVFDFILLDFFKILVVVIEMSNLAQRRSAHILREFVPVQLEECDLLWVSCLKQTKRPECVYHLFVAYWAEERRGTARPRCSRRPAICINLVE